MFRFLVELLALLKRDLAKTLRLDFSTLRGTCAALV